MSLLSWVGRVIGLGDGQFWGTYFGGETWAGRPVNEENSLQLSAWWRSVKLYADVVGSIPLKVYERTTDGDRKQVRDHPIARLIGIDPNLDQTSTEFWGAIAGSMAMLGNAYAEKRYVGKNLVALDLMPYDTGPNRQRPGYAGELWYHYSDRGKIEWLPREKVFHVRGFSIGKSDVGLSPLAAGRQGLSIALATEEATGKTFSQGLRTGGFFVGQATPTQRDQIEKTYIEPMRGNDAKNHYGIMPPGFDFKPISIHPKDAEMLLSRRFNVEEICRFMGVPPILIGHAAEGQTMWGSGVEAIILQWLTMGLDSFLTSIEKSINKRLMTAEQRGNFFAEFDRNALLRADSAGRAEMYWKLVQVGAMTPNQICDKENFARFDGGDVRLVNSTLQPLATLGQKPPARIQPAPGEPIPEPNVPALPPPQKFDMPSWTVNVPIILRGKSGPEVTDIEHDKKGRAVRMIKHQQEG